MARPASFAVSNGQSLLQAKGSLAGASYCLAIAASRDCSVPAPSSAKIDHRACPLDPVAAGEGTARHDGQCQVEGGRRLVAPPLPGDDRYPALRQDALDQPPWRLGRRAVV